MVLSMLMVQTLTTLLEPPPAIGGVKGLSQAGQPHQPQANIAVFMFLFMLCAAEVVFIKLLALTSFAGGDAHETGRTASTQTGSFGDNQPAGEAESPSESSSSAATMRSAGDSTRETTEENEQTTGTDRVEL